MFVIFLFETNDVPPVVSGTLSDVTMYVTSSSDAPVAVSLTAPSATDTSDVTLTSNYNPGDTFLICNTPVTYTAMDEAGNTEEVSFTVDIILGMKY